MKNTLLSLCMIGLAGQSFAQDVLYQAHIKKEEVPAVIVEAVETDFPGYVMEDFYALPFEYVEEDVVVNKDIDSIDDYETFEITLTGKGEAISATYNADGKLLNTHAHAKNVKLPEEVTKSITKKYPGWALTKDMHKLSSYANGKKKDRYKVVLKKGTDTMHVVTDENGKIVNKPKISR